MKINVTDKKAESVAADLYVVPVKEGAESSGALREFAPGVRKAAAARMKLEGFQGKAGKTLSVQLDRGDLLLVGLGSDRDAEAWRRAAARGQAACASIHAKNVVLCAGGSGATDHLRPLLEGFLLSSYRFVKYKSKQEDGYPGPKTLTVAGSGLKTGQALRDEVERTQRICEAVCFARDLINEMSTVKTPTYLAKTARSLARSSNVTCEVWQGERLRREGMNGILAVSAGSDEPGAFIKLVYKPRRRVRARIAIVGKGITFDSGGLSIKPAKSMEWMKQDMSGAAAVLAVIKAVSELKPDVEVRGYVAAAENMTGGGAQKPGDVITYRNGTTAEVLNTDAEGRLVLGDALCVASEEKPDCIIDLATLTGACIVALGTKIAGILGNDQRLVDSLIDHGSRAGERIWQLPLADEYAEDIRSSTADIQNIGAGSAGTITAALFLRAFVGDARWAHLDIAGPAFAEKPFPYAQRGGTGFGIRTLLSYIDSL